MIILALALCFSTPIQERPSGEQLIEQAWRYLPAYEGTHRYLLTEQEERETLAGAHLLQAGLALSPDHIRGLWSLGHARILLAENHRNRGRLESAASDYRGAIQALDHAIELNPSDAWSPYARAMAHTSAGQQELALRDLELTLANAKASGTSQDTMRFRALEWMPEVQMRSGSYAQARESLRAFHAEYSSNSWPMLIALGESFQRERDFAGARSVYQKTIEEYPNDFQAYALLGYLEGLMGNSAGAAEQMRLAIRNERFAGMYTRLWLWILAAPEGKLEAHKELAAFLKNPPDSTSPWDRSLGLFATGQLELAAFEQALQAELERRLEAAEPLDELACEAAYYQGERLEREGEFEAALEAYRLALRARPVKWKWEWAYARLGLARLLGQQDLSPLPAAAIAFEPGSRWHRAGTQQALEVAPKAWMRGDLILAPGHGITIVE